MVPSRGGLVWSSPWSGTGEGPYTLAAKILNANSLRTRYFRTAIRWAQGTGASLLDPRPTDSSNETEVELGRMLRQASLAARIPSLYRQLATDRELRYCSTCMSSGFQAAIAQIQGLDRCPIHGDLHRNTCAHCGAKTPPYFLEDNRHIPGFSCRSCGFPLGGRILVDRRFDAWAAPEHLHRLSPIHNWLERINSSKELHWVNLSKWSTTRLSSEGADDYTRYAVFGVLRSRLMPDEEVPESNLDQKPDVFGPYSLGQDITSPQELRQTDYDDVLRRLTLPSDLYQYRKHLRTPSFGVAVPTSPLVPPHLHAHLIWRAQFENVSSIFSQPYSRSDFCRAIPRLLDTAMDRAEVPLSNRALNEGILTAAWTASLKIAVEWHRMLIGFRQLPFAQADRDWLIAVDRWAKRLGCWRDRSYFPIAVIKIRDTATGEHQLYFVVA